MQENIILYATAVIHKWNGALARYSVVFVPSQKHLRPWRMLFAIISLMKTVNRAKIIHINHSRHSPVNEQKCAIDYLGPVPGAKKSCVTFYGHATQHRHQLKKNLDEYF